MGKRLIIKGADFSANGFYLPNMYLLDSSFCTIGDSGINASTGELMTGSSYSSWKASDFIETKDAEKLIIVKAPNASSFGVAFYDESKTYISGVKYGGNEDGIVMDIPHTAGYIRYCHYFVNNLPQMYLE